MDLYHVLNRGVDKRTLFLERGDYARFVHDMWAFNQEGRVNNVVYSFKNNDFVSPYVSNNGKEKKKIVDIHGWCLMKNHYHLLLSERKEGGIIEFTRKLNIGYAKYFNEKYDRVGTLFQGRTKKVLIENDRHLMYILHYIHLNPLDYLNGAEAWREGKIGNANTAFAHLSNHRWSSYLDYCGTANFPSVLTTHFFSSVFDSYPSSLGKYVRDLRGRPDTGTYTRMTKIRTYDVDNWSKKKDDLSNFLMSLRSSQLFKKKKYYWISHLNLKDSSKFPYLKNLLYWLLEIVVFRLTGTYTVTRNRTVP